VEEQPKKKQVMRFNDEELLLIKGVFSENEDLLKVIRKVFYQMPLNAVDLSLLQVTFKEKEGLKKVLRKVLLPTLSPDVPLQQNIDLWLLVKVKELPVSEASVHIKSIKIWIDYMNQQLKVIESGKYIKKPKISFNELTNIKNKTDWDLFANMLARNTIVNHVEQQLQQLLMLAGLKNETPEQTIERLHKDSAK
jgi:hypothetical protein